MPVVDMVRKPSICNMVHTCVASGYHNHNATIVIRLVALQASASHRRMQATKYMIIGLNEEAGYKRARPGRKQCLFYHIHHMSQYGCITKIRELSCHAMAMAPAILHMTDTVQYSEPALVP